MENFDRKKHWETIYQTKQLNEVSWYQAVPETSLLLIEESALSKDAKIIDVGGGDSFLVDHLLEKGYTNITVLDISEAALERAKNRLGDKASLINWITVDASAFLPSEKYDLWHDRAAFHFLTNEREVKNYVTAVESGLKKDGILVVGTFSEQGPKKCSGIEIKQYSAESLADTFKEHFVVAKSIYLEHPTPFETVQNFVFCTFRKA